MAKRVIDRMQGYSPGQMVTGVYKGYAANFGFLITDDKHEDIYIGKECRGNAMHNDTVQVEVLENHRPVSMKVKWYGSSRMRMKR